MDMDQGLNYNQILKILDRNFLLEDKENEWSGEDVVFQRFHEIVNANNIRNKLEKILKSQCVVIREIYLHLANISWKQLLYIKR